MVPSICTRCRSRMSSCGSTSLRDTVLATSIIHRACPKEVPRVTLGGSGMSGRDWRPKRSAAETRSARRRPPPCADESCDRETPNVGLKMVSRRVAGSATEPVESTDWRLCAAPRAGDGEESTSMEFRRDCKLPGAEAGNSSEAGIRGEANSAPWRTRPESGVWSKSPRSVALVAPSRGDKDEAGSCLGDSSPAAVGGLRLTIAGTDAFGRSWPPCEPHSGARDRASVT